MQVAWGLQQFGSAAFNLLMITSVCVCAIPAPDTRRIVGTHVYMVTASLSLFAYFWLIIVLKWMTPDKVDVEEAVLTLLFFPFLIVTAFLADKGCFQPAEKKYDPKKLSLQRSRHWIEQETCRLRHKFGTELPAEALKLMLQIEDGSTKPPARSRAQYRRSLMSSITSGKKVISQQKGPTVVYFGFEEAEHAVLECCGKFSLKLVASQPPGATVDIHYFTKEESAKSGVRYKDVDGIIRFAPNQVEHYIDIPIIDNNTWEPDEHFFVHLADLQVVAGRFMGSLHGVEALYHQIGIGITRVTIINDDVPGTLDFDFPEVYAKEGTNVTIGISRSQGTCGNITCKYATKEATAIKGVDFTHVEGTLNLSDGEKHKTITIPIHDHKAKRFSDDRFKVKLSDPSPGVLFNKVTNGGADSAICEVVISKTAHSKIPRSCYFLSNKKLCNSLKEWRDNFEVVWYCNGSASDQAEASPQDWMMHCTCLVFKVLFSTVPPASLFGGWPCFILALAWIGLVTTCVGDLASLLGCTVGLPDDITAITLVALGTSLPDTLASKTAAEEDDTADNSVGNVTGSNCVNVFLGLGLPWCLASIMWKNRGPTEEWQQKKCRGCNGKHTYQDFLGTYANGGFMVPASSLAFSVSVFTCCALLCILLLFISRRTHGGELGGPQSAQYRDVQFWPSFGLCTLLHPWRNHSAHLPDAVLRGVLM